MILRNPSALYLLFGALLILLLHFLRSRERRREVSALFLWEGLPGDPQSKAARIRQQIDPLLLVQLGILAVLTLAIAQPLLRVQQRSVSQLAIVIDASASMHTLTDNGETRYDLAVAEAIRILEGPRASNTVLIHFSEHPQVLANTGDIEAATNVLSRSEPTWYADGNADGLLTMLGSVGGASHFDRIVILSDHLLTGLPQRAEQTLFSEGDNVGLTAFSVRQNLASSGVSAFVEVVNATNSYVDTQLRISDGENQTTLALMLGPVSAERYSIPFPSSRGSVFTATLETDDDLPNDNQRYFALDRPIDVRVFWIGERNRYLSAALQASVPVTEVTDMLAADLIVVNQRTVPSIEQGAVLLIQSGMEGVLELGDTRDAGPITAVGPRHPLIESVNAENLRIRQFVEADFHLPASILLSSDEHPILAEIVDPPRRLFVLLADLMSTNLPVTVDFPILIRNLVHELVRVPPELSFESPEVGDFVALSGRGPIHSLEDHQARSVLYSESLLTFAPTAPGIYTLTTDRGAYALTVNIPATETQLQDEGISDSGPMDSEQSERLFALWPILLALGVGLLLLEAYLHLGLTIAPRRTS